MTSPVVANIFQNFQQKFMVDYNFRNLLQASIICGSLWKDRVWNTLNTINLPSPSEGITYETLTRGSAYHKGLIGKVLELTFIQPNYLVRDPTFDSWLFFHFQRTAVPGSRNGRWRFGWIVPDSDNHSHGAVEDPNARRRTCHGPIKTRSLIS